MRLAAATESYAAHLNFLPRVREQEWDPASIADFEEQTATAKQAMETAWLEHMTQTPADKETGP